jgi:hypothetical protein
LKPVVRIGWAVLALAGALWIGRTCFPGDEKVIQRRLRDLAATASFPVNEAPLAKVTNAAKVAGFFTEDTDIDLEVWEYGRITIKGRDEVRQTALGARNATAALAVDFGDVEFTSGPSGGLASVRATLGGSTSERPERRSQELKLDFKKVDGQWRIARVRVFEYLSQ